MRSNRLQAAGNASRGNVRGKGGARYYPKKDAIQFFKRGWVCWAALSPYPERPYTIT